MNGIRLPTREEQEEMERRRERSSRASQLMADHLLRGCKMLADTCDTCGCVLLETREGARFCVTCQDDQAESQQIPDTPAQSTGNSGGPTVTEVPLESTESMYSMRTANELPANAHQASMYNLASNTGTSHLIKNESTPAVQDASGQILLQGSNGVRIYVPAQAHISKDVMQLICSALNAKT